MATVLNMGWASGFIKINNVGEGPKENKCHVKFRNIGMSGSRILGITNIEIQLKHKLLVREFIQ
jgi:hypothetical protein